MRATAMRQTREIVSRKAAFLAKPASWPFKISEVEQ
jgi:hypothetical protein